MQHSISYGKNQVTIYRTYARPLVGLATIPESAFVGRANTLFAVDVDVEVIGNNFLPAYTEGDNTNVVATDSMKNFIHQQALSFEGATLEEFLAQIGREFLTTYPQMQQLRLRGEEQPFAAAEVPQDTAFGPSTVLFSQSRNDYGLVVLEMERVTGGIAVTAHQCGRAGLKLIKLTGSSFAQFVRDQHTTLPEMIDRPLFIHLDVEWKYRDPNQFLGGDYGLYIASEQVRDVIQTVFHQFVSKSIQHLVYEMALRLFERFPQMQEVNFEAQNRLWETALTGDGEQQRKVYIDPRPPYGLIRLRMNRDDL